MEHNYSSILNDTIALRLKNVTWYATHQHREHMTLQRSRRALTVITARHTVKFTVVSRRNTVPTVL